MKKNFTKILMILVILCIVERIFSLSMGGFDNNEDKEKKEYLISKDIAREIALESGCKDIIDNRYSEKYNAYSIMCSIQKSDFSIYIFSNNDGKKKMLTDIQKREKNDPLYSPCFKSNINYIICENPTLKTKPRLIGAKFYQQFSGEDIPLK